MTNKQILKKAIEKASGKEPYEMFDKDIERAIKEDCYYSIIFSHDFAKAFWGEGKVTNNYEDGFTWQYHLQQMVLEKEPLKYLEKFI